MNPHLIFKLIDVTARRMPEACARPLFAVIGTLAGLSSSSGIMQLRANYERVAPASGISKKLRSATAMRHYLRYYYEAFRLPYLTPEQIDARVSVENMEPLAAALKTGSCTAALMHAGNWDLAGAWATRNLAPVHTVAEKLEPPEITHTFLDLRRKLGMTIYHAEKSQHVVEKLTRDMAATRCFVPLLCDRDLSATGVDVNLFGHHARVAPGPAILAQKTGSAMFPIFCIAENFRHDKARVARAGTTWGIRLIIGNPITPQVPPTASRPERVRDVQRMMDEWAHFMSSAATPHLTHWHMLQKVFVADLDPARLARAQKETP